MEKEVKITLKSEADYNTVLSRLPAPSGVEQQLNSFYTNQYLSEHKISVRLREIDGKCTLTTKIRVSKQEGFFVAKEQNIQVDKAEFLKNPAQFVPDELKSHVSDLKFQTSFKNARKIIEWNGFLLEIDHAQFQNEELFEIECETESPEQYKSKVQDLLSDVKWKYSEKTKHKIALKNAKQDD